MANEIKQYFVEDDYYIDIVKDDEGYEVWFYDDCAGLKILIMNVDFESTEDELLQEVIDNFIDHRDAYDSLVEAMEEIGSEDEEEP